MTHSPTLWDIEDASTVPRVRDTEVIRPATFADVTEFCRRYHYTRGGGNAYWPWGLWHGQMLLGIVAYGLPALGVVTSVFGPEHGPNRVWHMARLAMAETAPSNSESRLIAGSLRAIPSFNPDVWGVITYAATDAGHIGYVYQATNAIYTGVGGHSDYYVDRDGRRRASGQMDGKTVTAEWAAAQGWTKHEGGPKHRYVYVVGSPAERRRRRALVKYPSLPYPKAVTS